MKKLNSELLMPAGNLDKLRTAVLYGADAIYLGTPDMSLRTKAEFTLDQVREGIEFAHAHNKRVYLTLNLFSHNKDVPKLEEYVATIKELNPDGVIIADPGVFQYVRTHAPGIPLHVSTQANVCSWMSVKFWEDMGADLCVLAREVSFAELVEIREKCPDIKLEAFVHGAMCMTYSGRCLLSNFMSERGANQGNCANSCRWGYKVHLRLKDGTVEELEITEDNKDMFEFLLEEGHRPGDFMPIEESERAAYILNSKDLCLMPKLDEYLALGIDSLKVEGRGKSIYYVAVVARIYRKAMDDWARDPQNWDPKPYMDELMNVSNRGFTLAFHDGRLSNYAHNYEQTQTLGAWEFAGQITDITQDAFIMLAKNRIQAGDVMEFLTPDGGETVYLRMYEFENALNGKVTEVIHAGNQPYIRIPFSLFDREDLNSLKSRLPVGTVVRKETLLTDTQWNRVKLDKIAQRIEVDGQTDNPARPSYVNRREKLRAALAEDNKTRKPKVNPKLGLDGCCGRGCNGCLMFWNDPAYAKAREIMAKKKQGQMLDRDMRESVSAAE
ncbi:MAG TPA: peptidase U32 [Hellea balneolensis]|uniref:Peptidase U32 n=1 Tax=Hellea balneolensis TaxID=287478 RepID=A0A7C5R0C1_9PROT|nr:peptidase U32 [Hellea balneolensis]